MNWLTHLKIRLRLTLAFGTLLGLMSVMFAASHLQLSEAAAGNAETADYMHRADLVRTWLGQTELNVNRTLAIAKSGGLPAVQAHFGPVMKETTERISAAEECRCHD